MRRGRRWWGIPAVVCLGILAGQITAMDGARFTSGRQGPDKGIASTGWLLRPVGTVIEVGEMPQNCALSPDGRKLAVVNAGFGTQSLMIVDVATHRVMQTASFATPKAVFRGLAFSREGDNVYVSGGPSDCLRVVRLLPAGGVNSDVPEIALRGGTRVPTIENPADYAGKLTLPDAGRKGVVLYPGGLALAPDGQTLWVTEVLGNAVVRVDLAKGEPTSRTPVGANPYDVLLDPDAEQAYVSLWGESKVAVLDLATGRGKVQVPVALHPCGLCLDAAAHRLYVACAHSDEVDIIDTAAAKVVGRVSVAPYANAPMGSNPTALALSPDRHTLYVADAGNNAVDVITLDEARETGAITGRLPTGWYPTAVAVGADGTLWVTSGRGVGSTPNGAPGRKFSRYIPGTMAGTLQAIAAPTAEAARRGAEQVAGYDTAPNWPAAAPSPIPRRAGDVSPLKYCVYIIKENRTYDQVFGDLPQGDGDPRLVLFGRDVTTNQHRLADDYTLLDNFYCDGTVSVDGHQWCKAASVSDGVERGWGSDYSQRGPIFGGPLAQPASPWIWEQAKAAGIDCKVFQGGIDPGKDLVRVDNVLHFVSDAERAGTMPPLIVMHLPNNHTMGTSRGKPTPKAMVAENDLAVGRLIEGLSHSRFWPQMAVFIVEDDAQDGGDHIDAHRSPALVISPWVRRHAVDHTHYDQMSVLRTMELIVGLQPLSQFDAAALPLYGVFTNQPTVESYTALTPKQPLDQRNAPGAIGQAWSDKQDWREVDNQPVPEFNAILWADAKGPDVPPPSGHSARFALSVRDINAPDDDDGDAVSTDAATTGTKRDDDD